MTEAGQGLIQIQELTKVFYTDEIETHALSGIHLSIDKGEYVAMSTTVAGRDDRAYSNPNVVDLDRRPRHVAFGYGPHACLGLHLARREMRIALQEFLLAIPEFHLAADAPIQTLLHSTIQPMSVPIEWAV